MRIRAYFPFGLMILAAAAVSAQSLPTDNVQWSTRCASLLQGGGVSAPDPSGIAPSRFEELARERSSNGQHFVACNLFLAAAAGQAAAGNSQQSQDDIAIAKVEQKVALKQKLSFVDKLNRTAEVLADASKQPAPANQQEIYALSNMTSPVVPPAGYAPPTGPQPNPGDPSQYSAAQSPYPPQPAYAPAQPQYPAPQSQYQAAPSPVAQPNYAAPLPQPNYAGPAAQPAYPAPAVQPTAQPSYNSPSPQSNYAPPAPQAGYQVPAAPPVPQSNYAAPAPQPNYAPAAPQAGYPAPAPAPQQAYVAPVSPASQFPPTLVQDDSGAPQSPGANASGPLSRQIVEQVIHESLYPDSHNSNTTVTSLDFHSVQIAKSRAAHLDLGIPDGTQFYPVLVKFTSTTRIQMDPSAQPLYTIHDIAQVYNFFRDDFGNWSLKIIGSSENRDVQSQHN